MSERGSGLGLTALTEGGRKERETWSVGSSRPSGQLDRVQRPNLFMKTHGGSGWGDLRRRRTNSEIIDGTGRVIYMLYIY